MINDYVYETLSMINSLNEDFSIWQCKLMILEHNIIINEFLKSDTVSDKLTNAKLDAEQKIKNTTSKVNNNISKLNILKSTGKRLMELFEKIITKFISIFKKFKEVSIKLFASNEKWLRKYKPYILNANLSKIKYEHEIFTYWEGVKFMNKFTPRTLNMNDKRVMSSLTDVKTYQQYLVKTHIPIKSSEFKNNDFIGSLKNIFRGSKVHKFKGDQLKDHLMNMYNFCMGYKNISNEFQTQIRMVEQASNEAKRLAKDLANGKVDPHDPNNAKENKSESGMLLYEMVNNNAQTEGSPTKIRIDQINKYKVYLNVNASIISCKMEISEEKYHAYMALLRDIVHKSFKQTNTEKQNGVSYDTRTDQIENSKALSKNEKIAKQQRRNSIG